ncbi:MAG TPA: PaaI family thioesterase [Methanotrichaceae archaeon]|nr:PaaI family thioesterase [Methanotrichaceae archaeon]
MNYLERIRQMGRDANPFFVHMGIEVSAFGNGTAELSMEVLPCMMNGAGWMQGGLFTALCDEAMALALFTILDEVEGIATISESTSYLQGIRDGKIIARGQVVKKARHIAFTEGSVQKDDGEVLSKTTASFAIIPRTKA